MRGSPAAVSILYALVLTLIASVGGPPQLEGHVVYAFTVHVYIVHGSRSVVTFTDVLGLNLSIGSELLLVLS